MVRRVIVFLCLFASPFAIAGQQLSCGPATVVVSAELNTDRSQDFFYAGVLTVEAQGHQTTLQYRGDVDFLGATCVVDRRGKPKVLFQATCTGSACHDLDNWGIIDAANLRVELIPTDNNRQETQRRLGVESLCTEGVALGTAKDIRGNCKR